MNQESVIIVLPLPAKVLSPNATVGSIGGRFAKAAATKRYRRLAKEAVNDACVATGPWKAMAAVKIYYGANRARDEDNAMGSIKAGQYYERRLD